MSAASLRLHVAAFLACVGAGGLLHAVDRSIPAGLAGQYFEEAQAVSDRDGGRLWGVRLYGPILLVDPETRVVAANQKDGEGRLSPDGGVWAGALPETENIANTAATWAGVKWTMLMWPLPEQKQARLRLVVHELFHRVQDEIGLPAASPSNRHLDSKDGRVWLQLEWRALETALRERTGARRRAIEDALTFRALHRSLSSVAAAEESVLELNEGLAEYTGTKLSARSPSDFTAAAGASLRQPDTRRTFSRSFAYLSGPAYGALLDASKVHWRDRLKPGADLGALLAKAYHAKRPLALPAEALRRGEAYDGADLMALESRKEAARQEQLARYRSLLVQGPVLILPLSSRVNYSFNPNNVVAFDDNATVYPTLRLVDDWGILEVANGALLIREAGRAARVQVPAPVSAQPLRGQGWTLTFNDGWRIAPAQRPADLTVKKTP